MATGYKAFRRIQISNPEDTPGTAEAATEILYGTLLGRSGEIVHQPEEDRNNLSVNMADDEIVGYEAGLTWEGDLNHRHANYLLAMAIRGNVTPTQGDPTNQPNAYTWPYTPALTTPNTPDQSNGIDTFTIEFGDNLQAYEIPYCFITRLEISGAQNEVCKFTAEIGGTQRSDTTFTGSLTAQSVQRFPFNLAKFYIDTSWANLGTTQKQGLLRAFTWSLETMFRGFVTADGQLYFYSVSEDKKKAELSLTYVRGTNADAERTKHEGRTTSFLRLDLLGQTELDSGQSNPPYLRLDQAVRYFDWPEYGDDEGLATVQVTAESVYDSTGAKQFEAVLYTDLSAWPT